MPNVYKLDYGDLVVVDGQLYKVLYHFRSYGTMTVYLQVVEDDIPIV